MQILPGGPLFAPVAQLAEAANLRSALCRCKSGLEHLFGACTGQANRDSVLRSSAPSGAGVQVLRAPLSRP